MGSIKKKSITRPLPNNAVISERRRRATARELRDDPARQTVVEQVATWRDRTGAKRTACVVTASDGSVRVRVESETYYAKYRNAEGLVREVPTGCRDRQSALTKLADLERQVEKVKSGTITFAELRTAEHIKTPTIQHISEYVAYLESKGTCGRGAKSMEKRLLELVAACHFDTLRELNADALLEWLSTQQAKGRSARVLNSYIESVVAFGYWLTGKRTTKNRSNLLGEKRLSQNPFAGIGKYDERADKRRERRALTEEELRRLLYVARWRPLAEFGRESERLPVDELPASRASRRTWRKMPLTVETMPKAIESAKHVLRDNPGFADELDRRGRERALVYKMAVLTGCRRGELGSLTVGSLDLDAGLLTLRPQDTKNKEPAVLPLRIDLVADLREWLESKRTEATEAVIAMRPEKRLPPETPLFHVPTQLVKCLDRDLAAAGIPKRDERGRTIDIHALRHTFGTMLSRHGVSPRTAQQAMRHSDISLTMNTYTDPKLLDIVGAVESLPTFDLKAQPIKEPMVATGTSDSSALDGSLVAPTVAPKTDSTCQKWSISGKIGMTFRSVRYTKKPRNPKGIAGFSQVGVIGFEPTTLWSQTRCASQTALHPDPQTPNSRSTPVIRKYLHHSFFLR